MTANDEINRAIRAAAGYGEPLSTEEPAPEPQPEPDPDFAGGRGRPVPVEPTMTSLIQAAYRGVAIHQQGGR
jgi:hypothetical protein